MSLSKRFRNLAATFLMVLSTIAPMGGALVRSAYAEGSGDIKPISGKTVVPNGDGTYTITLSVKGTAKTETESTKANVVVVFDTSGSMDEGTSQSAYVVDEYGRYGLINNEYVQLYRWSNWWNRYVAVGDNDDHENVYYWDEAENGYTAYTDSRYKQTSLNRLAVAQNATNSLAEKLLNYNVTTGVTDMVQMAFIDFASTVKEDTTHTTSSQNAPTTSIDTFKSWVNATSADGGTNWEAALSAADSVDFGDNDPVYIIFVSDGNPTYRTTSHGDNNDEYYRYGGRTYHYSDIPDGVHGSGRDDPYGWNLEDAQAVAANIVSDNNNTLYAVGVFGSADNMRNLNSDAIYKDATDQAALNAAFDDIVDSITNSLSLEGVQFTDGITDMTSVAAINGVATNFTYTLNGNNWADAPAATFTDSEDGQKQVVWNVGNLSDGDEATVSFVVWPSQEAYDLVADLNNGDKEWSDEYASEVVKDGDNYSLKTNTEWPKLEYTVVQRITDKDGNVAENKTPGSDEIHTIGSASLDNKELIVSKQWKDELDKTQAEKIKSINFNLYRDNKDSVYKEYTLTAANDWKGDEVAVAPGVMISASSERAKQLIAGGIGTVNGDWLILESGHDYWFEEVKDSSSDYAEYLEHFDLTKYQYHPMMVNGVLQNVIFAADGSIESIEDFDADKGLYAENTIKGGINITKELDGVDVGQEFEMTVYLVDAEGKALPEHEANTESESAYSYDYKVYYNNEKSIKEHCASAKPCDTGHKFGTGNNFTESIRPGDVIRVVNVMTGAYFRVVENEDLLPIGYKHVDTTYQIGAKENPSDAEPTYSAYKDADTATIGGEKYYVVKGNSASLATVKNKYDSADLKISKIIDVTHGDESLIKAKTFKFNVTLKDGNKDLTGEYNYAITKVVDNKTVEVSTGTITANGEITLGDGETATIKDLPVGATYTIEEQDANKNGFTTTVAGAESGTLAKAGAEVAYTNTYNAEPVSTQIVALKDFNDWTSDDTFYFTLKENGNTIGTAPVSEKTNKKATFDVTYTEPGTYTYTIEESTEGFGDRGITSTPNVLNVTVKVEDDGKGKLAIVEGYPMVDGEGKITNTYESTGSLTLSASKILTGRDWQEGDSFTFYLYEVVDGKEVKKGEVTATNANAVAFTTINYTTGDSGTRVYVIREATENMPAGVTAETGEVTINVTLTDNHNGSITTNFDNDAHVAQLTNVYKTTPSDPAEAVLKVKKTITDLTNSKKDGNFTFQLQDKDGNKVQEKVVTTENLTGETPFNGISFDEAGTYEYKIVEIAGNTAGFTYDDSVYNVKIVVKDDTTKAKLYVESIEITKDGAAVDEAAFTNIYEADASDAKVKFDVVKTLTGFEGETPATFTFNMTGDATDTQTIQGSGSASFKELKYTEVGEYTYTISEQNDKADGYTYDESVYTVTVNVVDENGKLVPHTEIKKGEETVNEIKFENNYSASGDITLKITKAFDGDERDWSKENFKFKLTGDGIEEAMTAEASEDSDWIAAFDKIEYTKAGEYKYTITEADSGLASVKASDPVTVTVTVKDMGDGTLKATAVYDNDATITNTYDTANTTAKLHVDKEIDDQSESGVDGTFTFTLSGDSYSDTQNVTTNGGKGGADFKDIEFSKAGTYNFTLKEVKGNEAGYTYDEKEYAVEIVVKDNYKKAQLEVESIKIDGKDTSSITITNVYKATAATYELKVKKTLNGLAEGLEPAVFSFELTGDATGTQTINGSGEASFGKFTYETTGTHNYTIKEVKGSAGGYTYDGATYTIEVKVEDKDGTLVATPTIKKDGESATSVEFVNVYKAEGSIDLYVTKDVQGRPWLDSDKFEFTLFDESGEAVGEPVTVDSENKTAKFTLTYSEKDHNQKYNYTISETGTLPAGMTKPADITATVSVTDNGDGAMKIEATDGGKYTIVNSYKAESVDTTIRVNKKIDDQSNSNNNNHPIGGTFYFTLEGEGYSDYQAVGLRGGVLEGGVDFKAIEFTEAGTYTYTLQEAQGALGNFTYDTNEYTVLVVVEDNYETGKLEVKSVTIAGDETKEWTITNIYKADPVDVQFEVTKVLNGMNEGVEPVEFEFELTGDGIEEAQTVTIKGAGSEKFDPITFEQTGTYKYEIVEIDGGAAGYLYDIAKYIIEVTVTDEGGKLVADVQIKKDGQSASNVTFENNYEATPITDYAIEVNKVLEGRELREGEFSFTLYDEEGNEVMTVLNDADGKVIFDGLSFEKPDTYVFTVKENANENNSDVEFDENEYTITIVVKDNGEGELVIESDDSSDVTFTNIYHEPGRGDTPENPKTEDDIMRNIAMLAISVLGLIGTAVFGKRKLAEDEE